MVLKIGNGTLKAFVLKIILICTFSEKNRVLMAAVHL